MILSALSLALASAPATGPDARTIPLDEARPNAEFVSRAVELGRKVAAAAAKDSKLDAMDRRNAQAQFAMLLYRAGRCQDTLSFIAQSPDIKAVSIDRIVSFASRSGDRQCLNGLARIMLDRWDDDYFIDGTRASLRMEAAAALDASGDTNNWRVVMAAEDELSKSGKVESLWNARFKTLGYYSNSPWFVRYLEHLAQRVQAENASQYWRKSIYPVFAFYGRCDLVKAVAEPPLKDCIRAKADADRFYRQPPANLAKLNEIADALSATPPLNEEGLKSALAERTVWGRLTRLVFMVERAQQSAIPASQNPTLP